MCGRREREFGGPTKLPRKRPVAQGPLRAPSGSPPGNGISVRPGATVTTRGSEARKVPRERQYHSHQPPHHGAAQTAWPTRAWQAATEAGAAPRPTPKSAAPARRVPCRATTRTPVSARPGPICRSLPPSLRPPGPRRTPHCRSSDPRSRTRGRALRFRPAVRLVPLEPHDIATV